MSDTDSPPLKKHERSSTSPDREQESAEGLKFSIEAFSDVVEVNVGSSKTKFIAYAHQLCSVSTFFKAACNERWESGRTRSVWVKDYTPDAFSIFMSWLLTGKFSNTTTFIVLPQSTTEELLSKQWHQLARCYIMGDFLQAADFQNDIIDALLVNQKRMVHDFNKVGGTEPSKIKLVWANTPPNSPLREIVLQHVVGFSGGHGLENEPVSFELQEYLSELVAKFIKTRLDNTKPTYPWENVCNFHVHPCKPKGYSCSNNCSVVE